MSTARRIWLTGASSGLGGALAQALLAQGHQVAISARSLAPLKLLERQFPGQVLVVAGDLTDRDQVGAIGQRIEEHWGALDSVILNAGTCEYMDTRQFDAGIIERVIKTNLMASAYCIEVSLPLLRKGSLPHLVGVSSSVTYLPLTRSQAYGASKAALRYLYESLRVDLAHEGIDVTVVSPGFVDTPLTAKNDFPMPMKVSADTGARYIAERLHKRPLEIAFPTLFISILRVLAWLPMRLQLGIAKRMVRQGEQG
ncbi:MAG: SDR family NAD(P)-dependent oxidoreductase [Pseudomonas sp.]|uniref:SDR family NAD(P)-dependent oxidoreductase n=1 Tax=Pseudomonas abieticivorans TaxID=2931382 RepID=UPI0020C0B9BA|nr:SDR family NAD(P)-dependent oxidoreductase [Pseudomonas sp. PIA16]MDE1165053.1 SDR family NAD(P)-dependent oxidoreductase [Pseudomonas sp.]